jgi:peptidoglycan/LPS O-acetylase OafA/YrhL
VANYSPHSIWSGLTPSWTLAIEVVFYLVLPVLALAALRLVRDRRHWGGSRAAWLPPLVLLAVGLVGKLAVGLIGGGSADSVEHNWHAVLDGSFVTHADLFSFGMGLAILHVLSADGAFTVPGWIAGTLDRVLLYVAPLLLVVGVFTLNAYVYHPVMALMATILLAKVVLPARQAPRPSLLLRTLETRPMLYLGTISYSIFLWNNTVTLFLHQHGLLAGTDTTAGVMLDIAIVACVTLVLSALTYRFVERPFLRRRPHHTTVAATPSRRSLSLRRSSRLAPTVP